MSEDKKEPNRLESGQHESQTPVPNQGEANKHEPEKPQSDKQNETPAPSISEQEAASNNAEAQGQSDQEDSEKADKPDKPTEVSAAPVEQSKRGAKTSSPSGTAEDSIVKSLADKGEEDRANKPVQSAQRAAARAEKLQQADPDVQTTSEPSDPPAKEIKEQAAEDREAKLKKAAEARAARAEAKAKKEETEAPKEPSPMQPLLDQSVQIIKDKVSPDAVEEAFINELDGHRPYIIIKPDYWVETARLIKEDEAFQLNYLRNVSGIDQETHMEVAYHFISLKTKQDFLFKVKTDREQPSVPSITSLWQTANWNEREIFDLLGIDFPGHPDLRRIMMPDDWVGHPLRKDYEPIDPEV
ncbi:NADH-quinone oxidoreductase subunit C [Paenibacillus sp. J2TS4]|uniref:NADH-quinone oxidoreductase subunit C n=1 Tax=Paenibacillus sp. J2TS4 TaxID=2807194 RepID=UPI001B28A9B0|nr:NADH-quinone oxidoreductase subunit C [Paenibacillus sp. J2TS4]GIP35556.1 hypothetical protein J2TS4_47660 [Paenibacillus sp. J2TS4]